MGRIMKLATLDFLNVFKKRRSTKKQRPESEETAKINSSDDPSRRDLVVEIILTLLSQLPRKNRKKK